MSHPLRRAAIVSVCFGLLLAPTAAQGLDTGPQGAEAPPTETPLATPVFSARRAPALLASAITGARIRDAVQPLVDQAPANSCIVISDGARHIVSRGGDTPMAPASTAKVVTGAAVLAGLDPDARLSTVAFAREAPSGGVVEGDLFVLGGGDPLLTTPGYEVNFPYPGQVSLQFSELADRIYEAGVRRITGGVVGDDSRYDRQRWVETWPTRYQREDTVGPLSALVVNDGSTGLSTSPDEPASARQPGDPPVLAAETLITYLERLGVEVDGGASAGAVPTDAAVVAELPSLTIRELVNEMILVSDNTSAELLTKELGLAVKGQGTTAAGLEAMHEVLAAEGIDTSGLAMRDGSGLDPESALTCELLVTLLDRAGPDSDLAASMPTSADTGTLYNRMRRTPAAGRVRAKSGTLDTVNGLAGYVDTEAGATLSFAYIVNGPDQPRGYAPIDELMSALATAPAGPDLATLAPRSGG